MTLSSTALFAGSAWVSRSLVRKSLIVWVLAASSRALVSAAIALSRWSSAMPRCSASAFCARRADAIPKLVPTIPPTNVKKTRLAAITCPLFRLTNFFKPVAAARRAGLDDLVGEIALDVAGEAVGRLVAPGAVLLQRLHHHPVELALQQLRQPGRLDAPVGGDVRQGFGRAQLRARPRRIDLPHHPQHLQDRPPLELLGVDRRRTGEQLVEHHAEGIDIGPRVDVHRRRVGLLGRHVRRRAHDRPDVGQAHVGQLHLGRLGHAEVDHLRRRPAVHLRHQHVARLQVAVDDPLLVGVLHRLADRDEQLQPGLHREPLLVAVLGERHAPAPAP